MNILLIGEERRITEMKTKFSGLDVHIEISDGDEEEDFHEYDVVMDLNFDDNPEAIDNYLPLKNTAVFLNTVKLSLAEAVFMAERKMKCELFGMNALPTFINRDLWEVSLYKEYQREKLFDIMKLWSFEFRMVKDRIGMVTPRVLFMIINEACYTVQEGTASIEDIDLAMKLGTNYPHGPFEWADIIGIVDVFETIAALYDDSKDERYKVCPLLKSMYLRNERFYKKHLSESV